MSKFKEKLSNYWYYYKWHTLIVLFFVTVISVLVVQMMSKPKYDVKIIYAGPTIITDSVKNEVVQAFQQALPMDYDGNGEKKAELFDLIIMNNEQLKEANKIYNQYILNESIIKENEETLSLNAMAGEYLLYIIDENCYDKLKNNGVFISLDSMGYTSGARHDEFSVYLKQLDFAKFYTAFDSFPDTTLMCIRKVKSDGHGGEERVAFQKGHIELFKAVSSFKAPEEK